MLTATVAAGDRSSRRLPRPRFVRSISESMYPRQRRSSSGESSAGAPALQRMVDGRSEGFARGARADTGFSVSSGETYVRGMPLEKGGLD